MRRMPIFSEFLRHLESSMSTNLDQHSFFYDENSTRARSGFQSHVSSTVFNHLSATSTATVRETENPLIDSKISQP